MTRPRRGSTLAELIVALTISTVVAGLAAAAMLAAERRLRSGNGASDASRLEQEVELLLRSEIRAALGDSLVLRGDTAIELLAHVGSALVCSASGRVISLPPSSVSSGVSLSRWRYSPAAGDLLYLYDTASMGWQRHVIDSAATRVDAAACAPATGFQTVTDSVLRRPVMRLVLASAPAHLPMIGTPVRVVRRGRWGLVRGTDRSWELAYRSCDSPGHCGPSQPVAGPLAPPADSGLRFALPGPGRASITVRSASGRAAGRPPLRAVVPAMTAGVP